MLNLKRNLLSVALASATMLIATGAHAQDAASPQPAPQSEPESESDDARQLDSVVVTGIRAGIERAIETKQASTSIVEAISAEDIGKLPDTSIADSIARLPGLTAQRFGGRPQEINIRGFAGDFSTTTLNGREQVSLGNNRGVEFDQYPSELINGVVVYKTPDASLIGQGLSGTVDLRTVRPLSFDEPVVAVNVRGDMNDRDGDTRYGNRFSISYIDQFADNTVGLALGYARLNNPQQGHQFEAWGYDTEGRPSGGKVYDIQDDNVRDGFMGVLEFKPNDEWTSTLDLFYSKFDKEQTKRGMEFGLNNPVGTSDEFTFSSFRPVIRNDYNDQRDKLFAIGWRNELKLNERWNLTVDISNSSATRNERILETYAGLSDSVVGGATGTARRNSDGYYELTNLSLDFGDPNTVVLTDAGGWGQDGYIKDFEVKDELTSVRFDLERTFDAGWFSSVEFGANLTDRKKSRASNEAFLCLVACNDQTEVAIPGSLLGGSSFNFAGISGIVGYDALDAYNTLYTRRSNSNSDITNKNWEVDEEVTTLYGQLNINTDLGSVPVRGNIGIQAVNVDQSSTGAETFPGNAVGDTVEGGTTYTDYLPSLNLSFELPAQQFVRAAAARQVARPRMDQLRANGNVSVQVNLDTNPLTGDPNVVDPNTGELTTFWRLDAGNPELKPWEANAYDVSYEKYFGDSKGYVSVAYFYKDLRTYIYDEIGEFNINDTTVDPADYPSNAPPGDVGTYSRPVNGQGGVLKGYELAVSIPLDLLWAPLEGFGLVASYSDTDSEIRIPVDSDTPDETIPLPGLSKHVSNITFFYERYGFSFRATQRHRSAFLGEVQGFGGDRERIQFQGETIYDAQVGYTFQSGALENLSVLLQVNNINNEPFKSTFNGDSDQYRQYYDYGRTYLLGVNYRF